MAVGVRYRVTAHNPSAHLFEVELTVAKPDPAGQRLWLPVWIPGSYLVRDFARHIVSIRAQQGSGARASPIRSSCWSSN